MTDEKKSNTSTFFWWKTEQSDISDQVEKYDTLGLFHSYRKISALLICFSSLLTIVFAIFGFLDLANIIIAIIFLVLAVMVYKGSLVFTLITMIAWTLAKFIGIAAACIAFVSNQGSAMPIISNFTFWTIGMSVFFSAYKVEQQKRNKTKEQLESATVHMVQSKTKHPIIPLLLQGIGVIAIVFVAANTLPSFLHIFKKQNNTTNQENITNIIPSPTSTSFNWQNLYLHKDKFKISLPNNPSQYSQSILLSNKKIELDVYMSTSSSNTTYTAAYSDLGNLYEQKYEKKCDPNSTLCEFLNRRDVVLKRRSPELKEDVYQAYFANQKGAREISKISDNFSGNDSFDFVWKNADKMTFTKGKIIIIDAKDLYILTAENESDIFTDFETFVYSWKPFGELSQ